MLYLRENVQKLKFSTKIIKILDTFLAINLIKKEKMYIFAQDSRVTLGIL